MDRKPRSSRLSLALRRLLADSHGAVLVEAAITLPIMAMLMLGTLSFGTWFMAAHGIQQAANEGARAAVGGVDENDRVQLVRDAVSSAIATAAAIRPSDVTTATASDGQYYTVTVTYAPAHPIWLSFGSGPAPSSQIQRRATIRLNSL